MLFGVEIRFLFFAFACRNLGRAAVSRSVGPLTTLSLGAHCGLLHLCGGSPGSFAPSRSNRALAGGPRSPGAPSSPAASLASPLAGTKLRKICSFSPAGDLLLPWVFVATRSSNTVHVWEVSSRPSTAGTSQLPGVGSTLRFPQSLGCCRECVWIAP
jgi:hypothetical protein